jgi:gas vesicle protein
MSDEELRRMQALIQQQAHETADVVVRSVRAWNELLAASTDMAFDVVLKNWDYSRSLRSSAEQAIADTLRLHQRLNREMLQAWEGYSSEIKDVLDKDKDKGEQ